MTTTNTFRTTLTATPEQFASIVQALDLARSLSTAPRTVSEYSGLMKRCAAALCTDEASARFQCNLEELKTMRRAVRKLMDAGRAQGVSALVYGDLAVCEEMLNAAVTTFNAKLREGGKVGCADITA